VREHRHRDSRRQNQHEEELTEAELEQPRP
jgi:hypothetical protein